MFYYSTSITLPSDNKYTSTFDLALSQAPQLHLVIVHDGRYCINSTASLDIQEQLRRVERAYYEVDIMEVSRPMKGIFCSWLAIQERIRAKYLFLFRGIMLSLSPIC